MVNAHEVAVISGQVSLVTLFSRLSVILLFCADGVDRQRLTSSALTILPNCMRTSLQGFRSRPTSL